MEQQAYSIHKGPNSIVYSYGQNTRISVFGIAPGVLLSDNIVGDSSLPMAWPERLQSDNIVTINYSISGICELTSTHGNYIYVRGGWLSISSERTHDSFVFPTGSYRGIEVFLDPRRTDASHGTIATFGISADSIKSLYLTEHETFLTSSLDKLAGPLEALASLFELGAPDLALLRLNTLLLLRELSCGYADIVPVTAGALTPRQVAMAKCAEHILASDLSRRIPMRALAERMGVSESSLKSYFRAVFGEGVADHFARLRLAKAEELLRDGRLSILEIAHAVGFSNQGKFSAFFSKHEGCTPSQYRRRS